MRNRTQFVKGKRQYSQTVTLSIYSANISVNIVYRRNDTMQISMRIF